MAQIIDMPKLSDTMTDGVLVKWLKKEGDAVKSGDMLAEIETDKATMELESFFDGTLLKIFASAGSKIAIGAPLAAIGKAGETVEAPAGKTPPLAAEKASTPAVPTSAATAKAPAPSATPATPAPPPATPAASLGGRIKISPLAKKLAVQKDIDPAYLTGSGPGGRIVRADILAAEKSPQGRLHTGPVQDDEVVPVSNVRGIIARRLLESKTQIPHFYLEVEVDAAPLLELRARLNASLEKDGAKLSVNDFILKACAEALCRVPAVNCSWENSAQPAIRHHSAAHVSFAVAIDDGLITPVIRDTNSKSILAISNEAKQLAKLAKDKKLKPDQFTGGTFCVSNLGMMGIERFSAIINPPNAAILAVGATGAKPVVKDGAIVAGQRMSLTLSCDHRVVDGATGAVFLNALRELLEKPALLIF
ncbi:MAG TPA: dihydrolipoamide acetyltransferase family protein [Opitutaceae bacterium]|nr:dihydrolipoamide acetyltransferase family protein [Opitutaceae bacterium]